MSNAPENRGLDSRSGRGSGRRHGDAEALGDILRRVMRDVRPPTPRRRDAIFAAWRSAAGSALAQETRPTTLRKGVLTIEVRSPPLLHDLAGFRRDELLSRFLAAAPKGRVTGLRFRLGVF